MCIFIAADSPMAPHKPREGSGVNIDFDRGTIDDGGTDDGYCLREFYDVDIYCNKQYGVEIEIYQCTVDRANHMIGYIRKALEKSTSVELWNVWLLGYWEYEDRPHIHKQTIHIGDLTANHIQEICNAENWTDGDRFRPWFYGIEIVK